MSVNASTASFAGLADGGPPCDRLRGVAHALSIVSIMSSFRSLKAGVRSRTGGACYLESRPDQPPIYRIDVRGLSEQRTLFLTARHRSLVTAG